jgi:outer membrane lipoprotein-sorting protein
LIAIKQTGIVGLLATLSVVSGIAAATTAAPDARAFTSTQIRTLQMDTSVVQENRDELTKIGGDFAMAYRFHKVTLSYSQPDKIHFESVVAGMHIAYTINGNTKYTSIPTVHVHKVEDVTNAPGKKQSLLDCGLLPPEEFNLFYATYIRKDGNQLVYRLSPKQASERFHDMMWIDPVTHITTKREHYNQDGKLMAWYLYKNPIRARPKIYVPSRVEVYNAENKLAAVTVYTNVKVNLPVDNSIFDF